MVFSTNIIAVGSDATLLLASNTSQKKRLLKNNSSYDVFIGSDALVTVSNGFPIGPTDEFAFNDYNGDLYGLITIVGSETVNVTVLEDD